MSILEQFVTAIKDDKPESLDEAFVADVVLAAAKHGVALMEGLVTFVVGESCGCAVACMAVAVASELSAPIPFGINGHNYLSVLVPASDQRLYRISSGFEGRHAFVGWNSVGLRFRAAIAN